MSRDGVRTRNHARSSSPRSRRVSSPGAGRRRKTEEELAADRANITLLKQPLRTLRLFGEVLASFLRACALAVYRRRTGVVLPIAALLALFFAGRAVDGPHSFLVAEIESTVEFTVWWVGLGVLSSIGLGSGMHSGLLFLFPHIFKVCRSVARCGSVDVDSRVNAWFALDAGALLPCGPAPKLAGVPFALLLTKTLPAAVLWGIGTAIGEVPPYLLARAAARAGQANEELDVLKKQKHAMSALERTKAGMISVLERSGFWGLVAMASWPNAAFDLCGICCGNFGMPFWTFFGATALGKGLIKAPLQCAFFSTLFSSDSAVAAVASAFPPSWEVQRKLAATLEKAASGGLAGEQQQKALLSPGGLLKAAIPAFMVYYFLTCLEQFAQARQAEKDKAGREGGGDGGESNAPTGAGGGDGGGGGGKGGKGSYDD